MSIHATAFFTIKSWHENPYDEMEGMPKLTRATVTKRLEGDIEAEGISESLMVYGDDGSANFVSLERIVGGIGADRAALYCRAAAPFIRAKT
jgi:hypothetical protein